MYCSTQFWESYLYESMKHGSITYGHAVLKGQRLLTWMFGGGSTMLVIFWLQWSDAAIKCLALIQGLYMNLVYIQSAHAKGTLLSYCTFYVHSILVMNSRLKMQTVLPKLLSSCMRLSTEVHLSRQERMASSFSVCCFHTCHNFHCVQAANFSPKALRSRTHFSVHGRGYPQASTFCSVMKSFISPIGLLLLFSCIQHISCLHLDWSVFFISICIFFLHPSFMLRNHTVRLK